MSRLAISDLDQMARFLIGTIPVIGHVTPAIPIARQLIQQGHEVCWYTGKAFQAKVEATGATYLPMCQANDYSDPANVSEEIAAYRSQLSGLKQLQFDLKYAFIESAVGQLADLTEILKTFPADVILADSLFLGAAWLHEKGGPVWAQFGSTIFFAQSPDVPPVGLGWQPSSAWFSRWRNRVLNKLLQTFVFREVAVYAAETREKVGLSTPMPPVFDVVSPYLYLSNTVPSFEYPRRDLPPQFHFVGPARPVPSNQSPPEILTQLPTDRPIVHVTQGTASTNPEDLLVPTLQALAEEKVFVIATTGNRPIEDLALDPLPRNAHVEKFIPHAELLPHIDLMITNGGFNGVHSALARGIPLITAGKTEEKPEVCARVAWSGVGLNLKTQTPKPAQIRQAVQEILQNPQYRDRAKAMQAEIAQYDFVSRSVDLLEELARTQAPVVRS
ncbi:glycosyl transferase [filamentous cyanobacterium LEGE 11480]|uniref:Glycosyl transferase n=1 Tax=Romeriopsis navalis LEGE 11480 TaxID=2777977 RepID=A0A928VJR5_9CYAN|nr:nucleotide disphospho-sugar-binding domain-containing protein [Romeriopsis navalis]MBE9028917.1 glycosyl transferase [Romeriopsis navalis LEGE 11480]